MKRVVAIGSSIVLAVSLFVLTAVAQDTAPTTIKGGVLNGKATSLPKPPYPPAARAVGASGAVSVQVLIAENGDVISATAVSGHPLLRAAAAQAARGAKFTPTLLQGQPVKVAGIITYNFVGALQTARLGFILAHAERTGSFGTYSAPESLAYQLSADWVQEKQILNSLTFEEAPVVAEKVEEKKTSPKPSESPSAIIPRDTNRYTVKGDINFSAVNVAGYGRRKLDAKSLSSIQNLLGLVEARASANESSAWANEIGTSLGVLVAEIEDQTKLQSNLAKIESIVEKAPSGVSQYSLQQVKEFVEFFKKENLSDDNKHQIVSKAEMLSNLKY